jgi:signal transduction histidine kinase
MLPSKANILVVDDTIANLRLLVEILSTHGYTVRPAPSGQVALAAIKEGLPDLILLDILMPDLDGYEMCQRLKADKRTQDIPVIFISALNEVFDKVTAFSVGGVDYITKPFHEAEVLARVHTHVTLRKTQQSLAEQNKELDAFAHTVAHDLKNPLAVIMGYSEMLHTYAPTMTPGELEKIGKMTLESTQMAVNIIDELLLLASVRKEQVILKPLNMAEIVHRAQRRLQTLFTEYDGQITLPDSWPTAQGYGAWIEEIWANYISNALKYGGRPPHVTVGATPQANGKIRFWVKDNGLGLVPEAQARLFTEFTRLNEARASGHGLGLSIVQRIMEKLGGEVGVESEVGQGSLFYFTLSS